MLNVRGRDWRQPYDTEEVLDATFVASRTRVILAADYSAYRLAEFKSAQDSLRAFKVICTSLREPDLS